MFSVRNHRGLSPKILGRAGRAEALFRDASCRRERSSNALDAHGNDVSVYQGW